VSTELQQYINDLLNGVSVDGTYITRIETQAAFDGTVSVNIRGGDKHIATVKLPPGWHQHEFVMYTGGNGTFRYCKKCGNGERLVVRWFNSRWKAIQ
jgi:hypothetical protein